MTARFFDIATMRYKRRHCRTTMGKLFICLESQNITFLIPLSDFSKSGNYGKLA